MVSYCGLKNYKKNLKLSLRRNETRRVRVHHRGEAGPLCRRGGETAATPENRLVPLSGKGQTAQHHDCIGHLCRLRTVHPAVSVSLVVSVDLFPGVPNPQGKAIREYMVFDREDLPYRNIIEKFNCCYCSYGNNLMSYVREIAARTKQYWCPIKHARRIKAAHEHYPRFFEYGAAESWQKGLERLRRQYPKEQQSATEVK